MDRSVSKTLLLGLVVAAGAGMAISYSSPVKAQQAAGSLTPFGAQAAGSADGAIPPYTGGISAVPNLPQAGSGGPFADPFASEKPLFSVTAANMAQYADMLTPGAQALLKRYSDYRIDVYPTHRTTVFPSWVLANEGKNAQAAQEVPNGDGVAGTYGTIPFPQPKDGYQVMWNSYLQYQAPYCRQRFQNYLVDTSGAVTDLGTISTEWAEPYYIQGANAMPDTFYRDYKVQYITPAAEAGQTFLFKYPQDFQVSDEVTYFYSPGTRRVRLAPEFKYDTPISSYGGAINYDEIDLFKGRMDKFNFQLVGEKEMIVPYNDYKFAGTTESDLLGSHHLNPDGVRWERHRVWVVDATLKPDARHVFGRWTFYVDEDSWKILATESYDHAGNIYKVGFAYPWQNYGQGDATTFAHTFGIYDLSKGNYEISYVQAGAGDFWECSAQAPNMSRFTAQAIAASAIR
jgi:hypothetical protein